MKTTIEFISFLSIFVTTLMAGLSVLSYRRLKTKEFLHLTEFWISLTLMVLAAFVFRNKNPQIVALSMVGWIWPLRGFRLFLEDICEAKLMKSWEYILLGVGGFISVALASYGYPFTFFSTPFAVSVGVVGIALIITAFQHTPKNMVTPLHLTTYGMMALYFINRVTFPFWRVDHNLTLYGFMADLLMVLGFAACTLSLYMEVMKERHENQLEKLVKERSDKLFGQSKYSELGMMSAGIAHEINNPLAIIQARTTQLLRIYRDTQKQKDLAEGLQQILYTSERINRTIQGVREFVHQDERMPDTDIKVKDLVDDVLAFCGQRMKNHGINLRFYGLENHTVRGHKVQLEQVILNLFNNSFDAIEFLSDKWIELSVHETPETIQIYVKDSGTGVPGEVASHMMEPFFSTKELGKGTGLGLALARGIIEKHGGTLDYLHNLPHTTFMIELPKVIETQVSQSDWGAPLVH
jgi:signal transduction histidine kinase